MFYKIIEYLSLNESINPYIELSSIIKSQNDEDTNIKNILSDFDKIREIYRNELSIFKIWYTIRIEQILYESNKIININKNIIELSVNFYLAVLIQVEINITNYKYSLEYIQNIYNQIVSQNGKKYYNFILSEIIIILLNNYKQIDTTNEYENEYNVDMNTIDELHEKVDSIIENNDILETDDISDKTIEEIYSMIIIDLIKNKLENFDDCINIIKEIELDKIDITQKMYEEICDFLKNKNDYYIKEEADFNEIKKINFYYVLLKYIFKKEYFVYKLDIFLRTREFIIKKIKSGNIINLYIESNDKGNKGKYIIERLLDSEYYMQLIKINNEELNRKENEISSESETLTGESRNRTSENNQADLSNSYNNRNSYNSNYSI